MSRSAGPLPPSLPWEAALQPADYFDSLATYRNLVASLYREAQSAIRPEDVAAVRDAWGVGETGSHKVRMTVVTEDWCGDSASVLPYIVRLAEAAGVPVRVFRQSQYPELVAWYAAKGTEHIPTVSVWEWGGSGVGAPTREIVRWVERPAVAHERIQAWLAAHPRFPELRARRESDPEAAKEYAGLYARLLRTMTSWYRDEGLWLAIATELSAQRER